MKIHMIKTATNKSLKVSEMFGFTFENGKIIESLRLVDFAVFFQHKT